LVARVYRAKLQDLHDLLIQMKHFDKVIAYAHVMQFQKRGLPPRFDNGDSEHAHEVKRKTQ
jgi:hypothetical protein